MSVLTERTNIPGPSLPLDYSRSARGVQLASRPALPSATTPQLNYNYTRAERKSSTIITSTPSQQALQNNSHRHSRTISSNTLPSELFQNLSAAARAPLPPAHHSRQSSSSTTMSMQRQPTTTSISSGLPRRSTSGRSTTTNSPSSYVALMRKQKATVWCDRSQSVDPRTAAAQKAAKHRAHLEVANSINAAGSGRTSTIASGGVVGKIRHGGVPKAPGYVPANMSGAGVPMRLSANEMLGDEEEDRSFVSGDNAMVHGRSGSGRSSTNSAKYRSGYPRADQGRFSSTSTPPSGGEGGSPASRDRIPEETPTESKTEYFSTREKPPSADEDSFGEFKELAGPSSVQQAMAQASKSEDLRRRGSVDERAMSMGTGVKLFVANPDIDSD
jgi:hypothetical protein